MNSTKPARRLIRVGRMGLLYMVLIAGAVVTIAPLIWMVLASFMSLDEILKVPPVIIPRAFHLKNYIKVFSMMPFGRFFLNSVLVAVVTVLSVVFTSCLGGYAFAKFDFPFKNVLFIIILGTMMIPFQIRMVPLYVMTFNLKLVDTYAGIILPGLVDAFGIFLMRQFMMTVPDDLLEAARIDGASEPYIFMRIVLPLLTPAIVSLTIFTLIGNWESFLWPLLVSSSTVHYTLPIGLSMFTGRYLTRTDLQMAAATITVLPMVLTFLILQRRFIEGVTMTGLKG